ncbi:MAG: hypothetical protein ABUT20_37195 [Bacteroidota bacterium]
MFKREILGKSIYEFEDQYFEEIKMLNIFGFNAWQIVKYPLYWELITQDEAQPSMADKAGVPGGKYFRKLSAQLKKAPDLLKLGFSLARVYLRARKRKDRTLIYAHSVDKAFNAEKEQYFNGLVDPFITNGIITSYIYTETPQEGKYKSPSQVSNDFKANELVVLSSFIRFFSKDSAKVKELARRLHTLLEGHFADSGIEVTVSATFLQNVLEGFCSEYKYSILFLKTIRPKLIITSERLGAGLLAASKKLGIPSIDLQHGLIDQHHAQYIYAKKMRSIKDSLIIPSFLGVFGRLHKNVLLFDEFWSEQEVVILGNSRIQANREKYKQDISGAGEKFVLIPTQKTTFRDLKTLLEKLIASDGLKCKVILKIHPLEPQANMAVYETLASRKPDWIQIATKDLNTYELMMKARLVIGFDSAVLLEAVSMMRPCVTLTTAAAPRGIHGFYPNGGLEEAIIPVKVDETATLTDLINQVVEDDSFYREWIKKLDIYSDNLYSKDYLQNCKKFINSVLP